MRLVPKDYFDSRERFRNLAQAAGGLQHSHHVASLTAADSGLSVDTAFLGNEKAENVLVFMSGVHGVEGYAGSACLQYFLQRYRSHYAGSGTAYLLVHALNPWGFANDSRVTEENIDLNRNFIDFAKPLPSSAAYARVHAVLCEKYRPGAGGMFNEMRLLAEGAAARSRRAFQEAATSGQYQYKNGLFFGGTRPVQNREIWNRIMQEHLRRGRNIRMLDIHTGLGKKGHGSLLTHWPPAAPKFQALDAWLDRQLTSTTQKSNVSALISGHLPGYTEEWFGDRCYAVTLEFGVASALFTLNALRAENWLRTTQDDKAAALRKAAIRERMRQAFMCRDALWEQAVTARFAWTVDKLRSSFGESAA